MLNSLYIENIAVIDKVSPEFSKGFNVLTGETGAGKSIVIDSINIILGGRAAKELIRNGCEKAVVEAFFTVSSDETKKDFEEFDIDVLDNEILIQRVFWAEGKSVCKINGKTVTTAILKELSKNLINIHGQHDNQKLLSSENHIEYLDKYAGILDIKNEYFKLYQNIQVIEKSIKEKEINEAEKLKKIDLYSFQINEIDNAKLNENEEEMLLEQRNILINSEKIINAVSSAYNVLYENEKSCAYLGLHTAIKELAGVCGFDEKLSFIHNKLNDLSYELLDSIEELRSYKQGFDYSIEAQNELENRLDLIYKLKRKYGNSIKEILQYKETINEELTELIDNDKSIQALNSELMDIKQKMMVLADKLSSLREKYASELEKKIMQELTELDMEKVRFKVLITRLDKFNKNGLNDVEFLISANPGEPEKPLVKIASGGELSRIILAIKAILSDLDSVETLIFDEIDTGVSGRAAQKIAQKMSKLSNKKQILAVTHLAQIASMADNHYKIEKNFDLDTVKTSVTLLDFNNRKNELARIIGGAYVTDLTLKNAEEMLKMADEIKKNV